MNKSILYSVLMGLALLVACDPVESRDEMTGAITAEQLNISVTPEVVDGVKSNKLILENRSPVLSFWNYGTGTSAKAYDEVLVTSVGDIEVIFTGRNGDGSTVSKTVTVNVESIIYEVTGMDKFIGSGSKTWVFDAFTDNNHPYGIGGVGDKSATWWGPEYGEFDEWDASITFSLDGGAIFTKTLSDGTSQKGSFSFNLAKKVTNWSQGILSLKGATIPNAYSVNNKAGEAYDFYILELEDDLLVLANVTGNGVPDNPSGEANFWVFRPEGYTAFDDSEFIAALTGGSEKTWGWGTNKEALGNNAVYVGGPGWWVLPRDGSIDDQAPGEGTGATMVFTADGTLKTNRNNGTSAEGTFSIKAPKGGPEGWSKATLKTSDVAVLCGIAFNEGNGPVNEYQILSIDDSKITLANMQQDESAGWYWVFTAE
ncbi:MAG: hypothetical protein LBU37_14565 [Tannerellaceae bacterium]|jgi:hypothetical protein|nr:hypothetical protein [Tannerellaceae bacterium]